MLDAQQLAEDLEFSEPVESFDAIRREIESLFEQGNPDRARIELQRHLEEGEQRRSPDERAWMYARLGEAYHRQDAYQEAIDAYRRAFEIEPRDLEVSMTLSDLLTKCDSFEEGLKVGRVLLLNHKRDLPDDQIAKMYHRLGELHEGRQEYEEARVAFEKALVKKPDDPKPLTGLLRVVGEIGEPADIVEARMKLIRGLEDKKARSMALVGLGNDWRNQFNDPARALDTFEEAAMEWPENQQAIEAIADVAGELGDWRRVCRAYFTLHMIADEPDQKADYLIESSEVARQQLWEPEKALAGYRKALQWDPTRLDAFRAVTGILVDARDWESLEDAYVRIISTNAENPEASPRLMGVLWQKLAELYTEHLDRIDDAIFAYQQAIEQLPDELQLRKRFVDLAEDREEHLHEAAKQLRELSRREPDDSQWLDRLGRVFLRQKEVDRAYCMFRGLRARGHQLDAKPGQFLERFDRNIGPDITGKINQSVMKRHIFAEGMSSTLNNCFSLLKKGLKKWVGESRRKYGLGWRDDVDLSENLAFVNFYKKIGAALGYVDLPTLWRKEEQRGLINGALAKGGLIVGDDLLGSGRERYLAFTIAKQLFLYMDPFYLTTIRPISDLKAFFLCAVALVRPETGLADQFGREKAYKKVYKSLRKNVKGDDRKELEHCIKQLTADSDEVVLGPWIEAIEDSANRIGLIFCDSLEVARECLEDEPKTSSERSVDQRMEALIDYSLSERFLRLRPQLGIEVA